MGQMVLLKKFISTLIFALTANVLFAQTLGFSLADGRRRVDIPIEVYNNLIVIPVVLNDALPLKFILDTGVRTAILTQKTFTDILNLSYSKKYTISGPGGVKLVDAYITNNVSLELPGVHGRGQAMLVLEQDFLELRNYLGTDVHGILGYELFSRFIVKVDYEKKILTLMLPDKFHKSRRFHAMPMKIEDTKPYIVAPVVLEDGTVINAKLLMDSGASHGLLLDPATSPEIKVPHHVVSSIIGRGLGGEIIGKVGRVKSIRLGSTQLNNVIANFPDPNSYYDSLKTGRVYRNGTLGGAIMSRYTVIFNFPKEEIYLKKNAGFKKNFYYNLSGLTVKAKGSQLNIFEVTEVRKESAGEKAGILKDDLILTINGLSTQLLNLNEVHAFFNSKPHKKLRMEILRNGQKIKRVVELEDQI